MRNVRQTSRSGNPSCISAIRNAPCSSEPIPSACCACVVGRRGSSARPTISRVTTTSLHPRRLAVVAATALAIPIAGCGGSDSSSGAGASDPAKAIPASAFLYVEANVRPTGKERTDLEAALRKILRTSDPGAKIKELVDKAGKDTGQTFDKDIKPWLGEKAGIAFTGYTRGELTGALVASSTDDDKARTAVEGDKDFKTKRSFEGADYRVDAQGTAAGVIKHFFVLGDEPAVKQIAHVLNKGGDSLATNVDLQDARKKVGGRPGFMFVDLQSLLRTAAGSAGSTLGPSELSAINGVLKRFRAFGVGIGADAQALRMSVATLGEGAAAGNGPGGALPLDKAPAASWLAFTQSDIGKSISDVLDSLKNVNSGSGGGTVSDAITQFETATGLKVKEDLLSWMGDAGLFVEGDSLPALSGALVIQSTDPAKTKAAITKLKRLLRQFGQNAGPPPPGTSDGFSIPLNSGGVSSVQIGLAGSRFVIAIGKQALRDALHPSSTLGSSATFQSAKGLLGSSAKPSFYLDWRTVTRYLSLAARNDPSFAKAKPYLDAFTAVIGGGSGDRTAEIAIGLK